MKRIIATISALLLLTAMLTACGDPVADDLMSYNNNHAKTLLTGVAKVAADFADATKAEDDAAIAAKLKTVVPESDDLLSQIKAAAPTTDEVKKINDKLLDLATVQNEGVKMTLDGVQKGDANLVSQGGDKILASGKSIADYTTALNDAKKAHNLTDAK